MVIDGLVILAAILSSVTLIDTINIYILVHGVQAYDFVLHDTQDSPSGILCIYKAEVNGRNLTWCKTKIRGFIEQYKTLYVSKGNAVSTICRIYANLTAYVLIAVATTLSILACIIRV